MLAISLDVMVKRVSGLEGDLLVDRGWEILSPLTGSIKPFIALVPDFQVARQDIAVRPKFGVPLRLRPASG